MSEEKRYTPLLPFNDLMRDNFIIYDNMTYVRDLDLTCDVGIIMHNPNMIKYYTTMSAETVKIGGD